MVDWFLALPHTVQALLATLFTWGVTALGAGLVFFFKTMNKNALDAMLGFAAGVMTAASFWSLLQRSTAIKDYLSMTMPYKLWKNMTQDLDKSCLTTHSWKKIEARL